MSTENFYINNAWACLRNEDFKKRGKNFYKSSDEVAIVINFQKSRFGEAWYLNFGIWMKPLSPIDDDMSIKENKCHISLRMESFLPEHGYLIRSLADRSRLREDEIKVLDEHFHEIFGASFREKLAACLTLKGLNRLFLSGAFSGGLVRAEARDYFASMST